MQRKRTLRHFHVAVLLLLSTLPAWVCTACRPARGNLLVTARTTNSRGASAPAKSATLYLLDEDPMKLSLAQAGALAPLQEKVYAENPKLRNLAAVLNARRREAYSLGPEVASFVEQSSPLWQPHVIQTRATDAAGRASFMELKPGDYWLMCLAETEEGGVAFWNLSIKVEGADSSVTLEPRNSLQCSACLTS